VSKQFKAKFKTLNILVREMRSGHLSGHKAWAKDNSEKLSECGSDLLFSLVKAEFIGLFK
jgi:hypothetical protein